MQIVLDVRTHTHTNNINYLSNWCVGHDEERCDRCTETGRRSVLPRHPQLMARSERTAGRRRPADNRQSALGCENRKQCVAGGAPRMPLMGIW